jgi:hypothetical protein
LNKQTLIGACKALLFCLRGISLVVKKRISGVVNQQQGAARVATAAQLIVSTDHQQS